MLFIWSCVNQGTARMLFNSFASSLWMMPFSRYCRADSAYSKHFSRGTRKGRPTYHCDEQESRLNFSGWPTNIINIEVPTYNGKSLSPKLVLSLWCHYHAHICCHLIFTGFDAYPSVTEIAQDNFSSTECGLPTQLSFSAREISDGTFFEAIKDYDPDSKRLLYQLQKCVFFARLSFWFRILFFLR